MKCPRCQRRLTFDATSCICGWGGPIHGDAIACHFAPEGCTRPARLRTNRYSLGGVQWPLCHQCDQRLHEEKAERWCAEHGLHTREQRIAYCLRMAGSMKLPISREPGQD